MNRTWTRYLPALLRERLEGRAALQKAIGNTGWLFADRILHMVVGLVVSVSVTRYLGPERYGLLSYATAFVTLFSAVGQLGLDAVVVRNIVRDPESRDETLGSAFLLKLAGGAVGILLILAGIVLIRPDDRVSQVLVAISSLGLLFQSFNAIDFWFQSQVRSKYTVYARSAAYLAVSAAKLALVLAGAPLAAFAWAGLADVALGSLGLVVAYRMAGLSLSSWRASRAGALALFRDSWPLMFSDLLVLIYMRADKVVLGQLAGEKELGIYSVATLVAEMLYFIPAQIVSSVFPSLIEARGASDELFRQRLQKLYNLMALAGYAVALPLTLLAGWLVPLLFGPGYARSAPMLIGLVWAGVFINFMIVRSSYLTALNWTRLHFIIDFAGCLLNLGLNVLLIPRFGGMGAVAASFVSYWFTVHGLCFLIRPLRDTGAMMTRALVSPKIW